MFYEGAIYRPPSEAKSLIIQTTVGCSHNGCRFCVSFKDKKFRIKTRDEIKQNVEYAATVLSGVNRIFLADGNALVMSTDDLLWLLELLQRTFPNLERVSTYATPQDVLAKTQEELELLHQAGLKIIYMGLETGSDRLLAEINKGVSAKEMVEAGLKVKESSLVLSLTIIVGLGGKELMIEHAEETAAVLNQIDPPYLGALTLFIPPESAYDRLIQRGAFHPLDPYETLTEMGILIANLKLTNCVFRSNHASNYLPLGGTLSRDRDRLLAVIRKVLQERNPSLLRPEAFRGL